MAGHRVRLTDAELDLVVSALRARRAGLTGIRRARVDRLAARLAEMRPGNPDWLHGELAELGELGGRASSGGGPS